MNRRTRNRICIWVILLGLANLVAYTAVYGYIGGDAKNGGIDEQGRCYIRGHFVRASTGEKTFVSRATWIYSYIHSISIWPTQAAILIAMLILARPHMIATMKENALIKGTTVVTICTTVIVLLYGMSTVWFVLDFVQELGVSRARALLLVAVATAVLLGLGAALVFSLRSSETSPEQPSL